MQGLKDSLVDGKFSEITIFIFGYFLVSLWSDGLLRCAISLHPEPISVLIHPFSCQWEGGEVASLDLAEHTVNVGCWGTHLWSEHLGSEGKRVEGLGQTLLHTKF
jgi:hypothetical protein